MIQRPDPCATLAAALAASPDPAPLLPEYLPCAPLDLLIALHEETTRTMLADLAHAMRAASAAAAVARYVPNDPLVQAQACWTQGTAILYLPDYVGALAHYDAALDWYAQAMAADEEAARARDVRVVQIVRVFCLSELGRYEEAIDTIATAEAWLSQHPNDHLRLTLLLNRSQLAYTMGRYGEVIELADATIALARVLDHPARQAQGWVNRGLACTYLGRYEEAEAAFQRGIAAATQADEPITVARAHLNRAYLLRYQGQLFAALNVLHEAEGGMTQATGEVGHLALARAVLYEQLLQLPEAQQAAHLAMEQLAVQSESAHSAAAGLRAAYIAIRLRQPQAARALLRQVKAQATQAAQPMLHAEIALCEASLAALPEARSSGAARMRAARAARRAVALLEAHGLVHEAATGALTVAALDALLGNLSAAIAVYQRMSEHPDVQVRLQARAELGTLLPPVQALPHLSHAAELAVAQRRALPMEELQARYSSETSPHHLRLAACHLALGDLPSAYAALCTAKAGPLLDLRTASAELDAPTQALLEGAKATIARWRSQEQEHTRTAAHAAQQGLHARSSYHRAQAEAAAAQLYAAEQALTVTLRRLGDRNGAAAVPDLAMLQTQLPSDAVLMEFARVGDDLGCFLVKARQPITYWHLGRYQDAALLLDRWTVVRYTAATRPKCDLGSEMQAALAPLWKLLIEPLQEAIGPARELLIAPYDFLHNVPWAALWDGVAHLGDRYTITLTPSGAFWAAPAPGRSPVSLGPPRLLGCPGRGALRLTHAAAELAAIARSFPDAQVVLEATSDDLRALPPPTLLHIAAHGHANARAPICSALEFADGPLLLIEAHRLHLRGTQLVLLSACETSVQPAYGEMALALAGAFLCAGAEAVVASLWPVDDAATCALMEQFYSRFAAGVNPADALRQAQHQLRATAPLAAAAFQLWAGRSFTENYCAASLIHSDAPTSSAGCLDVGGRPAGNSAATTQRSA